jgi:hypothetical protein
MSEPQFSVDGVFAALAAQPYRSNGGGRCVMFVAARAKEGVTSASCAVARGAGRGAAFAIDLDLRRNGLAKALAAGGALGPKTEGRFNGVSFYGVQDARGQADVEIRPYFSFHRVGQTRLYTGLFDTRSLPQGARVQVAAASDYWDAARDVGATVIVDAPALDRSQIALRVAKHMDGVVLVVGSAPGAAPSAMAAKAALVAAGANVMGLVYAGASEPVMAIDRLMRQAG